MKKYFPILLSKAGEIKALSNLTQNVKNGIAPIMQVLPSEYNRVEVFASEHWSFDDNQLFLDFSLCGPFQRTDTRNLISNLTLAGVNVVPVLQSNSDHRYIALLQALIQEKTISNICIRFSNGSGGFLQINPQVASLLGSLAANRNQTSILLDFGFVVEDNYNTIATIATTIIAGILNKQEYDNIIIASGSFLENLGSLSPADTPYRLQRFEWNIWQTLIAQPEFEGLVKYADYGTKYPYYGEANFQGSCSIKYTNSNEYIVYRGEISGNHPEGNGQYIIFAGRLVRSAFYSGSSFSWGDIQIDFYAGQSLQDRNRKTGNAQSWVEISQNHHITLLHSIL